jgi:hypothetical protein
MNWYKTAQSDSEKEYLLREEKEYFSQTEVDENISSKNDSVSEISNNDPYIKYQPETVGKEILYHGGRKKFDIEVDKIPSNGLFLSNQREVAVVNAMDAGKYYRMKALGADVSRISEDKIAEFYVDLKHPFIVDARGGSWLNVPVPDEMREEVYETMDSIDTDSVAEWAKKNNYDSAIIKNVVEGKGSMVEGDTYVVFNKNSLIPISHISK